MSELIRQTTQRIGAGRDVDEASAEPLLDAMIRSTDEALLADLFQAWDRKGIAAGEIYSIAKVMRDRSVKVKSRHQTFVDIVGTGGSAQKTFNVSTAAAFVVAGAGVPVAKHGNRAATSSSGSADVLSELGIRIDIQPDEAELCLNEIDICFMFAPNHHRLSPTLARVRRGLGFPTVFNCVGPLCNPADVPHQIIGVWSRALVPTLADALAKLGTRRSWIVNGHDRLDEISTTGHTNVAEVDLDSVSTFEVAALDVALGDLAGDLPMRCSISESADVIRAIVDNKMKDRDAEKLVLLNSAAAIFVTGNHESLRLSYLAALESVRSGAAARKLRDLSEMTAK
jgi:anthranilate phosphoribosyltransferase